jgi:hypothetical protein
VDKSFLFLFKTTLNNNNGEYVCHSFMKELNFKKIEIWKRCMGVQEHMSKPNTYDP